MWQFFVGMLEAFRPRSSRAATPLPSLDHHHPQVGYPILCVCSVLPLIPWFITLYCMVHVALDKGWYVDIETMEGILRWCTTSERVAFYLLGKVLFANLASTPFVVVVVVVVANKSCA